MFDPTTPRLIELKEKLSSSFDRRELLKSAGTLGMVGLAGCGGGTETPTPSGGETPTPSGGETPTPSGGETPTPSGGETPTPGKQEGEVFGGEIVDTTFDSTANVPVGDAQWNPYNPRNFDWSTARIIWNSFAKWNWKRGQFDKTGAKSFNIKNGKMLELTVRGDWHNGEKFTGRDVKTFFGIDQFLSGPTTKLVSGLDAISVTGDRTVQVDLKAKFNPAIIKNSILPLKVRGPHSLYGKYLQRFKEATSKSERDTVKSDLLSLERSKPIGNGPFKLDRTTQQEHVLVRHDGFYNAFHVNWNEYRTRYYASQKDFARAVTNNIPDAGNVPFRKENMDKLPDHFVIANVQENGGPAISFNHEHKIWGKRKVKQAVAHLVDPKTTQKLTTSSKSPKFATGLTPLQNSRWVNTDNYRPYKVNKQKATKLMQEAGMSKSGGTWMGPDGSPIEVTIKSFPWWRKTASLVATRLKDFGIRAQAQAVEKSQFLGQVLPNGQFDMAIEYWGGWQPHPYYAYTFIFGNGVGFAAMPPGHMNYSTTQKVPMPVGNFQGSTQTVNISDLISQLAKATTKKGQKKIISKLAWVFNVTLPKYPLRQDVEPKIIASDEFDVPPADDACYQNIENIRSTPIKKGCVHAKKK